ncbi:MAG: hypothetical protein WBB42_09120 [Polyangiales bacterium]
MLLADKSAKELDALVLPGGGLKAYRFPEQLFVAAEVDGKHRVDGSVPRALDRLLGPKFEMTQRLCRVQALTIERAREVVVQHHQEMPWRMVEIDRDLQPLDPNWFRVTEPQMQLSM